LLRGHNDVGGDIKVGRIVIVFTTVVPFSIKETDAVSSPDEIQKLIPSARASGCGVNYVPIGSGARVLVVYGHYDACERLPCLCGSHATRNASRTKWLLQTQKRGGKPDEKAE
jgi:hypothetical protein